MVNEHQKQSAEGIRPEAVKITTSLPKLRDASVAGIVKAYEFMKTDKGCEVVKKVFYLSFFTENDTE